MANYLVREGTGQCCGNGKIYCNKEIICPGAKVYHRSGCQQYEYRCYDVIRHDDILKCWVLEGNKKDSYCEDYHISEEGILKYYNDKYGVYLPIDSIDDLQHDQDTLREEYKEHLHEETFCNLKGQYILRGNYITQSAPSR